MRSSYKVFILLDSLFCFGLQPIGVVARLAGTLFYDHPALPQHLSKRVSNEMHQQLKAPHDDKTINDRYQMHLLVVFESIN